MATKVITGTYPDGYYLDPTYQSLSIESTADVEGAGVTTSAAQPSTIINFGKVNGSTNGISLSNGGEVMNQAGGSISGNTAILAQNGYAKVENGAAIVSNTARTYGDPNNLYYYTDYNGTSIVLEAGGKLSQISTSASVSNGVKISGGAGEVVNRGSIGGTKTVDHRYYTTTSFGYSVEFTAGGSVNNGANRTTGALIKSGIKIAGGSGTVTNNGTIKGANTGRPGIYSSAYSDAPSIVLAGGGTITNGTGVNTSALIEDGIIVSGGGGSVANIGRIGSPGTVGFLDAATFVNDDPAIQMTNGGSVMNAASGSINGISISGGRGTIDNKGTLTGEIIDYYNYRSIRTVEKDFAIKLAAGGRVTNSATGTAAGISISGGRGTITNDGSITGPTSTDSRYPDYNTTGFSVLLNAGGTVVNGSATNTQASLANGVSASGGTTRVTNFGMIGANSDGVSLTFDRSGDTLIEEGSGTLAGTVTGTNSRLVLAGDAGAGSIAGIGSTISGFRSIDVVEGSDWTLTGTARIRSGVTLSDEGTLHVADRLVINDTFDLDGAADLGSAGQLINLANGKVIVADSASISTAATRSDTAIKNSGLIEKIAGSGTAFLLIDELQNDGEVLVKSGILEITGSISGIDAGAMEIGEKATLALGAAVDNSQTIVFQKTTSTLRLDDSAEFDGTLSRFRSGDKIDLADFVREGTRLSFTENDDRSQGTLTVTNGAQVATLTFESNHDGDRFRVRNDGHGGSNLVYLPAVPNAPPQPTNDDAFTQALFDGAFGGGVPDSHLSTAFDPAIPPTIAANPNHA